MMKFAKTQMGKYWGRKKPSGQSKALLETAVWSAYIDVRARLVRGYFYARSITISSVVGGFLTVFLGIITPNLLSSPARPWWDVLVDVIIWWPIASVLLVLLGFLVLAVALNAGGYLAGGPEIQACARLMWDPSNSYWCKPIPRWQFWRRAQQGLQPQSRYPANIFTDLDKLNMVQDLAGNESSAAWGQATILGILVSLEVAVITTLLSLQKWDPLPWEWKLAIGGSAAILSFLALLAAFVASAATTIAQAITLLDVKALQKKSKQDKDPTKAQTSPWFKN